MRILNLTAASLAACVLLLAASTASAAKISGEYIEARTCDVYTGPCFANGEMDLTGKEALLAWKVDKGAWNDVSLDGLSAALVVKSERTLGYDGVFEMKPGKTTSVIVVDENASKEQRDALVAFVKDSAKDLTKTVDGIETAALTLDNDHVDGRGVFKAGDFAEIETRKMKKGDCVCTNETIYYQPFADVENVSPVYSLSARYEGEALNNKWTAHNARNAFIATFRK